ncbi:MAG: sigma-54-dependent Fis family transcriptional regulator [Nitrospirae bacterium]|nr:MAG: sigma-54-dependent Fis family transcriptional regulator [Nitrospirota bacterium]
MHVLSTSRPSPGSARELRSVLVVDDEPSMRVALTESLRRNGYGVAQAVDGQDALDRLTQHKPWLVLTDMKMARLGGLEVLKEIKKRSPGTAVVVMTAYGTVETAVEAMKQGASDYLLKPFASEALEGVLARLEAAEAGPETGAEGGRLSSRPLLSEDPGMARLLGVAEVVATSQATVLIHGESGTGKELLARFIHSRSPRAHRPFIAVNCAALPDGLLESELFGHERGAFTGALVRKLGKFEMAHTGTLLLDEISEMTLGLQAKLLRVLQEREVDRVGGREPVHVDIRVIATTNRPLRAEVDQGRFREDLYYRLNVFPILLPPLRERRADILVLARHFVGAAAARNGLPTPSLSEAALEVLVGRPWKGNVRELENVVERAVLMAVSGTIEPEHFRFEEGGAGVVSVPTPVPMASAGASGGGSLWEMERDLIFKTLAGVNENRTHAAKVLGISIRTLRNKLREYRQGTEPALSEAASPED